MTYPSYRGLTWDHPRGYCALKAAASDIAPGHGLALDWAIQPLEGFESASISAICAQYDLVVLDHPHIGEAAKIKCLMPLSDVFSEQEIADIEQGSIGPCMASYCYQGLAWALPLDASAQVTAYRADLFGSTPPRTWEEVVSVAEQGRVALSVAGPHSILTFLSMCVAFGEPPAEKNRRVLVSENIGIAALELFRKVHRLSVSSVSEKNPIGILDTMSRGDDVVLCPLIYGYVNYTRPAPGSHPIAFADAPRATLGGRPGSVLGGTGIGITSQCRITPELVTHLFWLMGDEAQRIFFPRYDGQPSRISAWSDTAVNDAWSGFYDATAATLKAAYVRPRHSGYIAWQTDAAAYLRAAIADKIPSKTIVRRLNQTFLKSFEDEDNERKNPR